MQFKKMAFFIILFILLTGCGDTKIKEDAKNNEIKTQFPLDNIQGDKIVINKNKNKVTINGNKNKVVLLNFFTTWCTPCLAQISSLNKLKEKYFNNLEIIGINLTQKNGNFITNEMLKAFKDKYNINYTIVNGKENYEFKKAMDKITTIPAMFIFDKKGSLEVTYVGITPEEMLEIDIQKALGS